MPHQAVWDLQVRVNISSRLKQRYHVCMQVSLMFGFVFFTSSGLIHDTERRKSDGGLSAMAPLKVSLIQDMR